MFFRCIGSENLIKNQMAAVMLQAVASSEAN